MAAEDGGATTTVVDDLLESPQRFDFYQAVRILQFVARLRAERQAPGPTRSVGGDWLHDHEIVRFRSHVSFNFPPAPIRSVRLVPHEPLDEPDAELPSHFDMVVTFVGMAGANGVLPRHYTQMILDRERANDQSMRHFFDLFNHRVASLFYRAWEKYRFPFRWERASWEKTGRRNEDLFTQTLYCLIGYGNNALRKTGTSTTSAIRNRFAFDDSALLYFSGAFSHRPRTAGMLQRILSEFMGVPTQVLQFQGQWLYLRSEDRSEMPNEHNPKGRNCELGLNMMLGERVWNVQSKIRIRLGPMTIADFNRLSPGGHRLTIAAQFIRAYIGPDVDFDVQPILRKEDVPTSQLGNDDEQSRLGWNSWVLSQPAKEDADDAAFLMSGAPTRGGLTD